jgi:hypothetical protein
MVPCGYMGLHRFYTVPHILRRPCAYCPQPTREWVLDREANSCYNTSTHTAESAKNYSRLWHCLGTVPGCPLDPVRSSGAELDTARLGTVTVAALPRGSAHKNSEGRRGTLGGRFGDPKLVTGCLSFNKAAPLCRCRQQSCHDVHVTEHLDFPPCVSSQHKLLDMFCLPVKVTDVGMRK